MAVAEKEAYCGSKKRADCRLRSIFIAVVFGKVGIKVALQFLKSEAEQCVFVLKMLVKCAAVYHCQVAQIHNADMLD